MGVLTQIASTSSKLEKERIVKRHAGDEMFVNVLWCAYNPLFSYGVAETTLAELKEPNPLANGQFTKETFDLLAALSGRDITGGEALAAIQTEMDRLNAPSGQLLRRILLKDLRAGFGASTINKARPGTIPDFPYMRCSLPPKSNMDSWDWSKGIIAQEKADGMFANVDHELDGTVRVTSRQGSPIPLYALEGFGDAVRAALPPGTQTHGELLVFENGTLLPREKSNGVMNSLLSGGALEEGQQVVMMAWDQIPLSAVAPKGKYTVAYSTRLRKLGESILKQGKQTHIRLTQIRLIPTRIVKSRADAYAYYRELLKLGKEGVIIKSPDAIWQDTTSKDQVKLKLEVPVELEVIGFEPGTPGTKYENTLGAWVCASRCRKLKTNVNGRTDALRDEVWNNKEDWLGAVVTVKANAIMNPTTEGDPHSLFLPVFLERRKDKDEADSLEEIQQQFDAAVAG